MYEHAKQYPLGDPLPVPHCLDSPHSQSVRLTGLHAWLCCALLTFLAGQSDVKKSLQPAAHVALGVHLQEIMAGRHEMGNGAAVEVLSQAIEAAERFPNLKVSPV